jgi:hypothetical protein
MNFKIYINMGDIMTDRLVSLPPLLTLGSVDSPEEPGHPEHTPEQA